MSTWYQMDLIARDRQERMRREADDARLHRLAAGRPRSPTKPRRMRLLSRSLEIMKSLFARLVRYLSGAILRGQLGPARELDWRSFSPGR